MGFYWSNKLFDKLKKSDMKEPKNDSFKKVYVYDKNGNYIQEFKNIISLSKELNKNIGVVSTAIYNSSIIDEKYLSFNKKDKFIGIPKYNGTKIPVYQYSLEGDFIESFESANSAAKSLCKTSSSKICIAIKKRTQSYGYLWSKEKLDRIDPYNKTRNRTDYGQKQVGLFNLEGVLVKKFDSFKDCYCEYPGFKHCLDKNRIAYKQYYFKTLKS